MFCNIDVVEGEIFRWKKAGYIPVRAVPFDMFPGTDETEIMVLFSPADAREKDGKVQRTALKGTSSTR